MAITAWEWLAAAGLNVVPSFRAVAGIRRSSINVDTWSARSAASEIRATPLLVITGGVAAVGNMVRTFRPGGAEIMLG